MAMNPVIPRGTPGPKQKVSDEVISKVLTEYLNPGSNRASIARSNGMSPSGFYRAVQRFLAENPDFLEESGGITTPPLIVVLAEQQPTKTDVTASNAEDRGYETKQAA